MGRGFAVIAGLSRVDATASFYENYLDGFDGRAGCEGVPLDLERMDRYLHYYGFRNVTGKPLLDADVSIRRFLGIIQESSSAIKDGDTLVIYLSCHGQALGVDNFSPPGISDQNHINQFLLYDRPVINLQIIDAIKKGKPPAKARIVTIIDACHAGIGSALSQFVGNEIRKEAEIAVFGKNGPVLLELLNSSTPLNRDIEFLNRVYLSQVTGQISKTLESQLLNLLRQNASELKSRLSDNLIKRLFKPLGLIEFEFVHLGASRSQLTALGGSRGSLFTMRLTQLLKHGGGDLETWRTYIGLANLIPDRHKPSLEVLPASGLPVDGEMLLKEATFEGLRPNLPGVDGNHYLFSKFLNL